jgi:hypothetical protein
VIRVKFADRSASGSQNNCNPPQASSASPLLFSAVPPGECCICYCARQTPTPWHLYVRLSGRELSKFRSDLESPIPNESFHRQVTLTELLSHEADQSRFTYMCGMVLSLTLAYSFYNLLGESWSEGLWKRDNVLLFADTESRIPLRVFLQHRKPAAETHPDSNIVSQPDLVELGAMLLEIYFKKSLSKILQKEIKAGNSETFSAVSEVLVQKKADIPLAGLYKAVKTCLTPTTSRGEARMGEGEKEKLRMLVFNGVIQPLEKDLENSYGKDLVLRNLDDEAPTKILLQLPARPVPRRPTVVSSCPRSDEHKTR